MINRAAILLSYKKPAVDWINDTDPMPDSPDVTVESANRERTVYLVPDYVAESADSVRAWIVLNLDVLFESELEGWYADEEFWPESCTIDLFDEWFEVECHSVLVDTVGGPILDDEDEPD